MIGFGGFGMLFVLIFWIFLLGLVVWAIAQILPRLASNSASGEVAGYGPRQDFTLDILQQRYARGEISKDEFKQMQADLTT